MVLCKNYSNKIWNRVRANGGKHVLIASFYWTKYVYARIVKEILFILWSAHNITARWRLTIENARLNFDIVKLILSNVDIKAAEY